MEEIKAGTRVLNPGGHEVDGRVVEIKGKKALVAYDGDGEIPSEWIALADLTPTVGRPKGSGVRTPKEPKKAIALKRRITEVVAEEMEKQDLTWDALVARSGVSRATIARIVSGNADGQRIDTIEALAVALGVPPGKFWDVRTD
jgi:DNA-binding Xre family transcriptional regulator